MNMLINVFFLSLALLQSEQLSTNVRADDASTLDLVNLSSREIARKRGFLTLEHTVTSEDGYKINVVHILPVNSSSTKRPVIFSHGTTQSSTYFMTNSVNARPKDLSALNFGNMTQGEMERLLKDDPTSKCLPMLLANAGHHVFMINRRGTEFSLGKVGNNNGGILPNIPLFSSRKNGRQLLDAGSPLSGLLPSTLTSDLGIDRLLAPIRSQTDNTSSGLLGLLSVLLRPQLNLGALPITFDSSYWNFSLDEQTRDLSAVIQFVIDLLKSVKVAYVGHSIGNGIMFMLLSEQPEWADKVEPFLAWSPDFYLGGTQKTSLATNLLVALEPVMRRTKMPFPPPAVTPLTRTLLASLCSTRLTQRSVCKLLENAQWGFSKNQTETLPAFVASQFYTVSSHEAAQFAQNVLSATGKMYHFDFPTRAQNMAAYGQPEPPIYNMTRVTSKSISLWHGLEDALATPANVERLKADLGVPVDDRLIDQTPFGHYDFLFGINVTNLVNWPSLQLIESFE